MTDQENLVRATRRWTAPIVVALAACSGWQTPDPPAASIDLSAFQQQRITWSGCADVALTQADRASYAAAEGVIQCGRLKVLVDYADPDGGSAEIALRRYQVNAPPPATTMPMRSPPIASQFPVTAQVVPLNLQKGVTDWITLSAVVPPPGAAVAPGAVARPAASAVPVVMASCPADRAGARWPSPRRFR